MGPLRNMLSQLAVPMRRKGKVIGALNLLERGRGRVHRRRTRRCCASSRAHVAVAIENARLFESERQYVDTLETLAEIGREMSSILDLDALLTRIASLTKRLIDYRTFGILLLNEATQELEMKLAVRYGKGAESKHMKLGEGLVGWAALHKEPVLVSDVSQGSALHQPGRRRAVRAGHPDADQGSLHRRVRPREPRARRLHQGAQGAADAAGQPGGGGHRQRPALRGGAAQRGAHREGAALRAARPGGAAADRAADGRSTASTSPAASSRRASSEATSTTFSCPTPNTLVVAVGDVSGKGAPAALYGAFAAELVRSRTMRRRFTPDRFSVVRRAAGDEHHPPRAPARGVLLHALLRVLRFQAARRSRCRTPACRIRSAAPATTARRSSCPACRSDRFPASPTTR